MFDILSKKSGTKHKTKLVLKSFLSILYEYVLYIYDLFDQAPWTQSVAKQKLTSCFRKIRGKLCRKSSKESYILSLRFVYLVEYLVSGLSRYPVKLLAGYPAKSVRRCRMKFAKKNLIELYFFFFKSRSFGFHN